jgi:hypothetical protein
MARGRLPDAFAVTRLGFMKIFYGSSAGRADVSSEAPMEASLDTALAVYHNLDSRRGFMGVVLDERLHLQLLPRRAAVRIELLDSSKPAFDASDVSSEVAESLIRAAFDGQDVFQTARQATYEWEHTDLA